MYCEGAIIPGTEHYLVKVGSSARDQRAHNHLRLLAKSSSDYYYQLHTSASSDFFERVRSSVQSPIHCAADNAFPRSAATMIDVCKLSTILRSYPHSWLNRRSTRHPRIANENKTL